MSEPGLPQETPKDPSARYTTPDHLVRDPKLSLNQKRKLLEEWEEDVRERLVASEEGMTGPDVQLADVLKAKDALPIDTPPRPASPSKA